MDNNEGLISKHLREFSIGSFLGGVSSGSWLFLTGNSWTHLVGEWIVRLFFTCMIALCSGLITAATKDWYERYKQRRSLKSKNNEQREKNKAA